MQTAFRACSTGSRVGQLRDAVQCDSLESRAGRLAGRANEARELLVLDRNVQQFELSEVTGSRCGQCEGVVAGREDTQDGDDSTMTM